VAKYPISDWDAYKVELNKRLGIDNQLFRVIGNKARKNPKRVVFAEAENQKILKTAQLVQDESIAYPILLGNEKRIKKMAADNGIDLEGIPIIDPKSEEMEEKRTAYAELFFKK
jgi:malate dehydrogenase (oxaloacetate-decarboxylating)(NADP+)